MMTDVFENPSYFSSDSSGNENEGASKERQHSKLLKSIATLDGKKSQSSQRSEPDANISEYNLSEVGFGHLKVHELVASLQKGLTDSVLKKQIRTASRRTKVLATPLPKLQAEKIKRKTAYEKVGAEVAKWDPVVERNRVANHLAFPLKQPSIGVEPTNALVETFTARTPLEMEIAQLLSKSDNIISKNKLLTPAEEKMLKAMDVEEARERLNELRKFRAKQSYEQAKNKRQKKIKSKRYHRILKRERMKSDLKEFEEMKDKDPEGAVEKLQSVERLRIEERMTLRHKNTGKWAKQRLLRAKYDKESRDAVSEQLELNKQLTQKKRVSSSSSESELDMEDTVNTPAVDNNYNPFRSVPADYNPWIDSNPSRLKGKPHNEPLKLIETDQENHDRAVGDSEEPGSPQTSINKDPIDENEMKKHLLDDKHRKKFQTSKSVSADECRAESEEDSDIQNVETEAISKAKCLFIDESGLKGGNYLEGRGNVDESKTVDFSNCQSDIEADGNQSTDEDGRNVSAGIALQNIVTTKKTNSLKVKQINTLFNVTPMKPGSCTNKKKAKVLSKSVKQTKKHKAAFSGDQSNSKGLVVSTVKPSNKRRSSKLYKLVVGTLGEEGYAPEDFDLDTIFKLRDTKDSVKPSFGKKIAERLIKDRQSSMKQTKKPDIAKNHDLNKELSESDEDEELDESTVKKNKMEDFENMPCPLKLLKQRTKEIASTEGNFAREAKKSAVESYSSNALSITRKTKNIGESKGPGNNATEKEADIDPTKFMTVETKILSSKLPELMGNNDSDSEEDSHRITIAEAFADDNVIEEFSHEKQKVLDGSKPRSIDISLPGWGSWGGEGLEISKKTRRRLTVMPESNLPPRKDQQLGNVIINEKPNEKLRSHQLNMIPKPFRHLGDFERSIRHPIGKTWNPETSYRDLICPAVSTKRGHIIEPMDADAIVLNKKFKRKRKSKNTSEIGQKIEFN